MKQFCALFLASMFWVGAIEGQETRQAESAGRPGRSGDSEKGVANDNRGVAPKRFETWLEEVGPLITGSELVLFRQLRKDYQRDAFIEQFWRVRDPFPETGRNEMRERFDVRLAQAKVDFGGLDDDRTRILLVHGEPHRQIEVRCTATRMPAVIWAYGFSDQVDFGFLLVFLRDRGGTGRARLWRPGRSGGIEGIIRSARRCMNGALLDQVTHRIRDEGLEYDARLDRVLQKPRPKSLEWVASFYAGSTDLPEGAATFPASLSLQFLGRYQSRGVLQGLVDVEANDLTRADLAGHQSYDLQLLGEVIRDGQLFERFRYKFGFPASAERERLPLLFQRYLRPGRYTLILKVEDLNGDRYWRDERPLDVPQLDEEYEPPAIADSETARLFAEANAAMDRGDTTIRIVPPSSVLRTGFVRFDTLLSGEIDRVEFFVDGKKMLTKIRPPYNVELDMGPFPRLRVVGAVAYDGDGVAVAEDQLEVNAGGQRFSVRLVEPSRQRRYEQSLMARAEVRLPEGSTLDRVEFFVDEELAATLYQEPFRQPLELSKPGALSYVRAVAYLSDGNSTSDHVFVNPPEGLEELDVQFVEVFASVLDRSGRPLDGLGQGQFRVLEDGVEQEVSRFELVGDLPIHVGVLIDNSASMRGVLKTARDAALRFFERTIGSDDRAAVITFNRFPDLAVPLTGDLRELGGGLAGLTAEGQTALFDSVMFALYYFTGVSGQRALLLLSDGKDEVSRFSFTETLEYARRAGVTVYSVGLQIPQGGARRALTRLAEETGGQSYFIRSVEELDVIYSAIEKELRSQYLIAYQSSNTTRDDRFRSIQVQVAEPGSRVRAMSGYYP